LPLCFSVQVVAIFAIALLACVHVQRLTYQNKMHVLGLQDGLSAPVFHFANQVITEKQHCPHGTDCIEF